ncbi:hypothetical protein LCGC14_2647540, partial [marine sediment metagenome]
MLSEQKFKKYWDADSSYFTRDNVWQFFKPYLQQPFDREAYKELLRSLPHIIALNHVKELLDELETLHTGGSEPVSCVLPSGAVELLKELAALGSMERALDISSSAIGLSSRANAFGYLWDKPVCGTSKGSEPDFEKGKTVCFECGGSGQKGAEMCKHCKGTGLVCATCGGSRRKYFKNTSIAKISEPCLACMPEH